MVRVLIADKMDKIAAEIFAKNGIEVENKTGLDDAGLSAILSDYDGLAVRSATKVSAANLSKPGKLKVIGRAGIGVDTIDVPAATKAGVVVMNTPFGNSITTAEHTIAMMMALARQIPQASASTHAGKWEKSAFMGTELYGKTLGIIGCGNIGSIVAARALGLQMTVVAFDPFLSADRAHDMGIEKAELDDVFKRADIITVHTPMTDKTRGIINAAAIAKMKKGVRLINCARGGLIVEADLKAALDSGHVAGAALDVFEVEPAKENILFGHPNVICTPHLGASTTEAQVNVAIQIAEQMSDFLLKGAVANAVNMPSISAEDAPKLKPYMDLATQLGSFSGQIAAESIKRITVSYQGHAAMLNARPLTACVLAALLQNITDSVNMVNAPEVAKTMGIDVATTTTEQCDVFHTAVEVVVEGADKATRVTGTLFADHQPRLVNIDGVGIEAALSPHMLFIRNKDQPGMIGAVGSTLAAAGYNIANFHLGRQTAGGQAIALVALDTTPDNQVMENLKKISQIASITKLKF